MNNHLKLLLNDSKIGILKLGRVGMIRRTLKFKGGVMFDELVYLPYFKGFVVLKFGGFE